MLYYFFIYPLTLHGTVTALEVMLFIVCVLHYLPRYMNLERERVCLFKTVIASACYPLARVDRDHKTVRVSEIVASEVWKRALASSQNLQFSQDECPRCYT